MIPRPDADMRLASDRDRGGLTHEGIASLDSVDRGSLRLAANPSTSGYDPTDYRLKRQKGAEVLGEVLERQVAQRPQYSPALNSSGGAAELASRIASVRGLSVRDGAGTIQWAGSLRTGSGGLGRRSDGDGTALSWPVRSAHMHSPPRQVS